jgi:hypothetical protein
MNDVVQMFFSWCWILIAGLGYLLIRKNSVPGARLIGISLLCGAASQAIFAWWRWRRESMGSSDDSLLTLQPWFGMADIVFMTLGVLVLCGYRVPGVAAATHTETAVDAGDSLLIQRRAETSLQKAESLRDDALELFMDAMEVGRKNTRVITYYSGINVVEPWWRIEHEISSPDGTLQRRATITWDSSRHDFHRFETLGSLTVKDSRGSRTWHGISRLREQDVRKVWRYLNSNDRRLKLRPQRVRFAPWELWRDANRLLPLRRFSPASIIGVLAFMVAMFFPPLLLLVFLGMAVVGVVTHYRHPHRFILSAGKPLQDPRALRMLANWHANLYGLGARAEEVFAELEKELSKAAPAEVRVEPEPIWYYGPDGKVERTQLAVGFRRVTAFVQVDRYGDDLHVGWDGHLNLGTWIERTVATGVHEESGEPVELRTFASGLHTANEYDYTDAAFLIEWLHSKITHLVKRKVKEHQIDQEIDFKIVRDVASTSAAGGGGIQRVG